ncbi:hypothetical protein [Erythrobacter crassostreae]|uniref:Uncharacterized protein n=1 Tax=Erythrobacter crassostreae TaxID=2828328 RepID=A0A9X1F551_9SPHN|nr:hypothetical protein [Erythrobacter crassostrea]MBV7258995.1 hypothetical protein [Erythrobacter crassostrea]
MGGISLALLVALVGVFPGILTLFSFYANSGTDAVKVTPPPLRSIFAIAMIGSFALICHFFYVTSLWLVETIPYKLLKWPLADPYTLLAVDWSQLSRAEAFWGFTGVLLLSVMGIVFGWLIALSDQEDRDTFLYGWLWPIIRNSREDNAFINAFALTTNQNGKDFLGYEGTVTNLVLDSDKNIVGASLANVEVFYLRMNQNGPKRVSGEIEISNLVLRKDDFQNIALEIIRDETVEIQPTQTSRSKLRLRWPIYRTTLPATD